MEDLTGKMSSKLLRGSILGKSVQIQSVYGLPLSKCHNSTILFLWLTKFEKHFFSNYLQVFYTIYSLDQIVLPTGFKKSSIFGEVLHGVFN